MRISFCLLVLLSLPSMGLAEDAGERLDFRPDQSELPVAPPQGAIVLFDGGDTVEFRSMRGEPIDWEIKNGLLISSPASRRSNHLVSTWHFRDAEIHAEFLLPREGSGNSGIYIHGNYELQIIHSFGKKPLSESDMGALYGFAGPLVNAARPRSQWQVYDIRYRAPRRDEQGSIVEKGSISAWLNGHQVQDHVRFGEARSEYHPYRYRTTDYLQKIWARQQKSMVGPLFLQDHDNPVSFRNVWIRPLDDKAIRYSPPSH